MKRDYSFIRIDRNGIHWKHIYHDIRKWRVSYQWWRKSKTTKELRAIKKSPRTEGAERIECLTLGFKVNIEGLP